MRTLALPKSTRAVILSYVEDADILEFLSLATDAIWVKLITHIDDLAREGADGFVTDILTEKVPRAALMKNGIVPIVPWVWAEKYGLTEFNPMKFEGNAFLFEQPNMYQIFASIVRYLENVRYPWDKRTLLQNVAGK